MEKDSNFNNAYKHVRKLRHGFHNPKGELVTGLRNQYEKEYKSGVKSVGTQPTRYKKYIADIKEENRQTRLPYDRYVTQIKMRHELEGKYDAAVKKLGRYEAINRYGYLMTQPAYKVERPKNLRDEEITKSDFKKEYDIFASIDRFIRHQLNEIGDKWIYADGTLSPKEQYERKIILFSLGRYGKDKDRRKKSIEVARKFFLEILGKEEQLEAMFEKKKIPSSRIQAQGAVKLAKLIVGEQVRYPTSSYDNDGEVHHSSDSLVNKLATLLNYLDNEGIDIDKVSNFIDQNGGFEATIKQARNKVTR